MDISDTKFALRVLAGTYDSVVESSGGYFYEGFAEPGMAAATAKWRVRRTNETTGAVEWKDGGAPSQAATDLPSLFA